MPAEVSVRTLDGTRLSGTFTTPDSPARAVVMVHGSGVTQDEVGLYPLLDYRQRFVFGKPRGGRRPG